ncbi:protein of unknown function DUF1707 [Acidimicrobium ferrooxidans DSM 10331]|uniref:DUF1707 domain-containing protein n=1 Tax=Acidimicrobium ferrooxidans (strain DSM 10331 / JCM 15462 / NBRC 103882 / ICP) TaxID=525909 RepID=C7M3B6_ACIFD|nr:DUF1707 domain-containing protein [Acidimicrobium ferrooxidans]ACU53510.1 protein of unknown function DUF1707 [Acidimicrobium ferrooxidans DSM 10331]
MADDREHRCSDAEREAAAERLRQALAAGELDVDEAAERIEGAYAARRQSELARLLADLRPLELPAPHEPGVGIGFNAFGSGVLQLKRSVNVIVNAMGRLRVEFPATNPPPRRVVIVNLFGTTKLVVAAHDRLALTGVTIVGSRLRRRHREPMHDGRALSATVVTAFGSVRVVRGR